MKTLALTLALSAGLLFSCDKEDDSPDPDNKTQAATLPGKWDSKTEERKEYNASGNLVKTENKTYDPGTQNEFTASGVFRNIYDYKVINTGTYTHTGDKINIKVGSYNIPTMYVVNLTASELVLRDTVPGSGGAYSVRVNRLTR